MGKVNVRLYEFLKDKDTGIYRNRRGKASIYAHIPFRELEEFVEILGGDYFLDDTMEVQLTCESAAVNVLEIIKYLMDDVEDYLECIGFRVWKKFKEIERMDERNGGV